MSLQAIIMAGGEGVRLRPLTTHLPKPLAPLLGEPTMRYAIELLKAHGVKEIGASLWYQPQKIRKAFRRGEADGVKLKYFEETEPLGTAGSVKLAQKELRETFFVLSGDGLTDCDLTDALRFHREKKALATLVLKRVDIPLPYGVVMTDRDSRITRFIEKPTWSRVFSDLVNTGLYILEPDIFQYIPDQGAPDFGKDVFPALLAGGLPVYGYETAGYWCDVGDLKTYLQAQRDLLEGRVDLPHGAGAHESAVIHESAKIEGKCYIGPNVRIGPGAVIRNSVIDGDCVVGPGVQIEDSCLWAGTDVRQKARISGSVLCDGVLVRQGAEITDGCALGRKAVIGAYSLLRPGVRVSPYGKTAPGSVAAHSVNGADWSVPQWSPQGAECDSAEGVCALCGAFIKITGVRRVIAANDGSEALEAIADGTLASSGADVYRAGKITEPMLCALIRSLGVDGGVYAAENSLRFFQRDGSPLTAKQRAAMDGCVLRQELPPVFSHPGEIMPFSGAELVYLSAILPDTQKKALYSPVAVFCDDHRLTALAVEGLKRIGARDVRSAPVRNAEAKPGETGFLLTDKGDDLTVFTSEHAFTSEEKTMLLLSIFHRAEGRLFDWPDTPRAAREIGALTLPDGTEASARQRTLLRDGVAGMLWIAEEMKRGPLETLMRDVPVTHIFSKDVPCRTGDKSRILHSLCDQVTLPYTLEEGMRIAHEGGFATIVPDASRASVRVTSEAMDSEFAKELCDFYFRKIENLAGGRKEPVSRKSAT